jgi:hypothetical protein
MNQRWKRWRIWYAEVKVQSTGTSNEPMVGFLLHRINTAGEDSAKKTVGWIDTYEK